MEFFRNITIGQYIPASSPIHQLDPRIKILLVIIMIIFLFTINSFKSYLFFFLFISFVIFLSSISLFFFLKSLKPLLYLIFLTFLLNLFMSPGETVIWKWSFIKITQEGLDLGIQMSCRIILLITFSSFLTFTTSPIELTDGIEYLLKPLSILGFPSHELAMMMTIALRFIPTLMEETEKIIKAQMARGADFETGNLVNRAKNLIPIFVPLFVSAFRRADELALAMEARCYRGGVNRTRMKELKIGLKDFLGVLIFFLFVLFILYVDLYPVSLRLFF